MRWLQTDVEFRRALCLGRESGMVDKECVIGRGQRWATEAEQVASVTLWNVVRVIANGLLFIEHQAFRAVFVEDLTVCALL